MRKSSNVLLIIVLVSFAIFSLIIPNVGIEVAIILILGVTIFGLILWWRYGREIPVYYPDTSDE